MSLFRDHVVITNFPEEAFGILPGAVVWWNWRTGNILRVRILPYLQNASHSVSGLPTWRKLYCSF